MGRPLHGGWVCVFEEEGGAGKEGVSEGGVPFCRIGAAAEEKEREGPLQRAFPKGVFLEEKSECCSSCWRPPHGGSSETEKERPSVWEGAFQVVAAEMARAVNICRPFSP